jgi:hypothetical protein
LPALPLRRTKGAGRRNRRQCVRRGRWRGFDDQRPRPKRWGERQDEAAEAANEAREAAADALDQKAEAAEAAAGEEAEELRQQADEVRKQ